MIRTFSELNELKTFEERFNYLALGGIVCEETFGSARSVNQAFYHSREWRQVKTFVVARDLGLDLGHPDVPVKGRPLVHHMNPLSIEDLVDSTDNDPLNPEFLITTSHVTHNAIHYGDRRQLPRPFAERSSGDTRLW